MKAKLIKVNDNQLDGGFYILRDLNGNPIGLEGNLSLKNCQAIERGFDLDELLKKEIANGKLHPNDGAKKEGIERGIQIALEIFGDKKYTEKQMLNMFLKGDSLSVALKSKIIEDKPISDIFNKAIQSLQQTEWDVTILMEKDEPKSFVKRKVIRKLDNGEEIEWTCFWDNGWFSAVGIKIPNVISWERLPILDADDCLILKPIK